MTDDKPVTVPVAMLRYHLDHARAAERSVAKALGDMVACGNWHATAANAALAQRHAGAIEVLEDILRLLGEDVPPDDGGAQ